MRTISAPLMTPTTRRGAACLSAACLAACLLAGCSGKDDAASAPGYYSGPMKAKASPKLPAGQAGNSSAAGQP